MVATTINPPLESTNPKSQTTANVSDFEIARRVSAIRSRWTIEERRQRRNEATRRFDALLESLGVADMEACVN